VAVLFALAVAPLTFLVGAALDYSGASNLKAHLQKATDGTGLRLCQIPNKPKKKELEDVATKMMNEYFGSAPYTIEDLQVSDNPRTVQIRTKSVFYTAIIKGLNSNFATIPVTATAACLGEPQTFEIALVLDNTGSMAASGGGQSKIQALRTAAKDFVDFVYGNNGMKDTTKVSLVPFAASVAVNPSSYRSASWIDQAGNASYHWNFVQGGKAVAQSVGATNRFDAFNQLRLSVPAWDWAGCFESLPYPLNVRDNAPTPSNPDSYFVPMFAPDETGDGGQVWHQDSSGNWRLSANSYMDDQNGIAGCGPSTDENTRFGRGCKYFSVQNPRTSNGSLATGPNFGCTTRPLTQLTDAKGTLISEIDQMQPNGNTDAHEGFMWGWRTISPNSVFSSDAAAYNKAFNNKIIILMTDGANRWTYNPYSPSASSYYSSYGFFRNGDGTTPNNRLPAANANPTNDAQSRNAIDALTLESCSNARAAPSKILIYTIGFSVSSDPIDQQGIDMLRACAGSSDRAFIANDSNALVDVFRKIAQDISGLRLTN